MKRQRIPLLAILAACIVQTAVAQQSDLKVLHYTIEAKIRPAEHRLISEVEMVVKNIGSVRMEKTWLELSSDSLHWVRDRDANEIPFVRSERGIRLSVSLSPSETKAIKLKYEGVFSGYVSNRIEEENSWLLTESRWFPQLELSFGRQNWFTYDLRFTVPNGQKALSSGELVGITKHPDRTTFHWRVSHPVIFISVISGKYFESRHSYGDVPITVYLFEENPARSDSVALQAQSVLEFYKREFGGYPFKELRIVETNRRGGYGPPGMILVNRSFLRPPSDDLGKYMKAFIFAHELAHHWWGGMVFPIFSSTHAAVLTEMFAQYSALQYMQQEMEDKEIEVPALRFPLVGQLATVRYYPFELVYLRDQKLYEYKPLSEVGDHDPEARWAQHFKGMFFLRALCSSLGAEKMQRGLREYVEQFKFSNPTLDDLRTTLERVSGKDLGSFFYDYLNTTKRIDYTFHEVQSTPLPNGRFQTRIALHNAGDISLPVKVLVRTESGNEIPVSYDVPDQTRTGKEFETEGKVVSAVIDPDWDLPDANRVNNYFPRKTKYSFLISQPPITIQQYYYGPSLTYGLTDGLRAGVWLTNIYPISVMKRVPFPLEFRLAASYGVKSNRPGYSLYVNSWLGMPTNLWSYGVLFEEVRGTQSRRLHAGYRWSDHHTIQLSLDYARLYDISYYDARDFEAARTTAFGVNHSLKKLGLDFSTEIRIGIAALSSRHDFRKVSLTISGWVPVLPRTSFRLFAAGLRGSYPSQEAIFLSGSPKPIGAAYWFLDPDRKISTQENLHIAGDANLRGYVGQHLRGRNALSLNCDFAVPALSFLRAFVDVGSVWDSGSPKLRWNAGVGFDFDLLRFYCPLFVSDPLRGEKKFAFRWLISL